MPRKVLVAAEVAARLGVSLTQVRRYVARGHLRSWRISYAGGTDVFIASEVERFASNVQPGLRPGRPRKGR